MKSCCKTDDDSGQKKKGLALLYFLEGALGILCFPKKFFRLNDAENDTLFNLDNVTFPPDNKYIPQ